VYDVILFPTDGSEGTAVAVEHAIDLARRHDATLDVLFAADDVDDVDSEAVLEEAASTASDAGVTVNSVTLSGSPQDRIVDYVLDRGADVVVMGTHGRRGLKRYVAGSVTEKVLRNVTVPVLVVPMDPEQ
jgi:nucleotide-binding universal stress UspA family protein